MYKVIRYIRFSISPCITLSGRRDGSTSTSFSGYREFRVGVDIGGGKRGLHW